MIPILCHTFSLLLALAGALLCPMPWTWMCLGGAVACALLRAIGAWCDRGVLRWEP